jgi:ribose/xylose/arabinose/galactoside ABC-type transport system permease subunit
MMDNGRPAALAVLIVLLIALGIGLFNGIITGLARINGVIATLAVAVLLQGILSGMNVAGFPVDAPLFEGRLVPILGWVVAALLIIVAICLMQFTPFGRRPRPGDASEPEKWFVRAAVVGAPYILSSLMAAVAGVVLLSQMRFAHIAMGQAPQTNMILASLIGGSILGGGFGSVFGAVLGALVVSILIGLQTQLQITSGVPALILTGIAFIVALLLSRLFHAIVDLLYRKRPAPE